MLAVSNSIKNAYNQYTTQRKSKIKVGNNEYFIQNMSLLADAYDEGNIVGNAIAKTLEFDIETQYVSGLDEFVLYDGVWTGEQYEYINLGTFKLFEEQGADDFFSHITAYDKLVLFNKVYDPTLTTYPTTVYGLLQNICSQAGVTLDTETIVNGNKALETNLFVENETLKDILRAICQVSGTFAVISEDKLKLKLVGEDVIELEDYQISNPEYKRTTWNINQVVLGMQDIDGEYVQKSDEEDIERNGVHKIVINNNPFTYTQELRQQYIDDLFDKLKGFGYFAFESDWEGLPYVELGDTARIGKKQDYKINLGKNLFNKDVEIKNAYPHASDRDVGKVVAYDNSSATYSYVNCAYVEKDKTYTISWKQSSTQASTNTRIGVIVDKNNVVLQLQNTWINSSNIITFTSRYNGYLILATDINATSIQIEQGQATSYAPYFTPIELCKIGTYQDKIAKSTGKNLLDISTITENTYIDENGNTGSSQVTNLSDYIELKPNTSYTLSYDYSTLLNSNQRNFVYYDENKTYISSWIYLPTNKTNTITTPNNTKYIRFSYDKNCYSIMVNEGTTALPYEPYGSKGKWLLTKKIGKVVLDGSETYSGGNVATNVYRFYRAIDGIKPYADSNRHIDRFITNRFNLNTNNEYGATYQYQGNLYFCVSSNEATTNNEFRTWLSTHNVSLYYVRETPTIEEITDSTLINQLENAGVEILGETTQEGTPTPTNPVPINNKTGEITVQNKRKSLVLRYQIKSPDGLNSMLQAPSIIDSVIDYIDNTNDLDTRMRRTEYKVDKANGQITSIVENVSILQNSTSQNADNINRLTSLVNSQGEEIDTLGTRITQTAENITASVSAIQEEIDNGVGLVKTTSVTIDDSGLNVSTDTSKISTTMTNNSFEIKDSGDKTLAFFGYDEQEGISKAEMDNLTVTNYFIAGVHRVETIEVDGEERTGYFYIGG